MVLPGVLDGQCYELCCFQISPVFYTKRLFQTAHWDGRVQDGRGGGLTQEHAEEGDPGEGVWKECDSQKSEHITSEP